MKHVVMLAVIAAVFASSVALAAEASGPPNSIISALLTPEAITTVLGGIFGAMGLFFGGATWLTARRKRIIATGAFHAFHIVEDWAALDERENIVDKAAKGLQVLDEWMVRHGWRPLKSSEQQLAKLEFSALHGAQKAEEKVRAAAFSTALGALGTSAALAPVVAAVPQTPRGV
ncbi:hypothetical protein [Myxococcus landrumensis]|uniref:Lipoprotein n=1 Tax=Myxococcus landrumensis TaxID=2813577 RepID=A0ABX7NEH7_9BACT|nr:hypothetical protein [Myxococcus landrumus]QSQ17220.1 hypothetical protein JY572_14665 [Myxococcus landrumus]